MATIIEIGGAFSTALFFRQRTCSGKVADEAHVRILKRAQTSWLFRTGISKRFLKAFGHLYPKILCNIKIKPGYDPGCIGSLLNACPKTKIKVRYFIF